MLILLTSCLTYDVRLEPLPMENNPDLYKKVETEKDLVSAYLNHILALRAEIYKLWISLETANNNKVKVIDFRGEYSKKAFENELNYLKYVNEKGYITREEYFDKVH